MNILKPLLAALLLGAPILFAQTGQYNFRVEISGIDAGAFASVGGLSTEIEVIEYQDGTDLTLRKRPGRTKYSNITLKRGYIASTVLNDWIEAARAQEPGFRSTMSIVLLNADTGAEVKRYNCHECWPIKWKLSGLEEGGPAVLTEELVIAIEWFEEA